MPPKYPKGQFRYQHHFRNSDLHPRLRHKDLRHLEKIRTFSKFHEKLRAIRNNFMLNRFHEKKLHINFTGDKFANSLTQKLPSLSFTLLQFHYDEFTLENWRKIIQIKYRMIDWMMVVVSFPQTKHVRPYVVVYFPTHLEIGTFHASFIHLIFSYLENKWLCQFHLPS